MDKGHPEVSFPRKPLGNPFVGPDSAPCRFTGRTDVGKKCQEIFAWGLRNPFPDGV